MSAQARPAGTPAASDPADGLVIEGLTVERASFPIVRDVTMHAATGSVTVVLGANGVGKTTLLEAVSGVIPVASGTIHLGGEDLTGASRRHRAVAGLGHIEQGRQVYPELTARENLEVAIRGEWSVSDAIALFPELAERLDVRAGLLSGGEQQMLVVARAMAARPKVLMVDEMSLGLAPRVAKRLIATMRTLADDGLGVLLVEQYAALALEMGDRAYVLSHGMVVYDGPCEALIDEPEVLRRAYLGEGV